MKRASAFTLVEIMVTTAMFGLLATAAFSVFSAGSRSSEKSKHYRAMLAHGQQALDMMAADIRCAVAQNDQYVTSLDIQFDGRDCDTIDFIAALPNSERLQEDEGALAEVGYYINKDPNIGLVGLMRREDRSLDEDPLEGGKVAMVAPYVAELNIEFFNGLNWVAGWTNADGAPKAARIQIVVLDENNLENPLYLTTTVAFMAF